MSKDAVQYLKANSQYAAVSVVRKRTSKIAEISLLVSVSFRHAKTVESRIRRKTEESPIKITCRTTK